MSNPFTLEELEYLAEKYGWQIETDNNGQIILYTGIYEKESENG